MRERCACNNFARPSGGHLALPLNCLALTAGVKDTLLSDDLKVSGSKIDLVRFFGLIDKAPGTFAIVTK